MIIVRLKGGLGNQMFQYALGRVLALKNNDELKLDTSFLNLTIRGVTKREYSLNVFNIKAEVAKGPEILNMVKWNQNRATNFLMSWLRKTMGVPGQEKNFNFDRNILNLSGNIYLDGYWQSPKYFEGFEEVIRKDFTLKDPLHHNVEALATEIENTSSLCVHIRRGDFVGNKTHDVVDMEYYRKGLEYVKSHAPVAKIYVFSDDIDWCKENVNFGIDTMFVDSSYGGVKGEGHMYLMSKCRSFIIANSSFSWWGAWLSTYPNKVVVAPKNWFANKSIRTEDLIPKTWTRI